jgi:cytochrome c551
MTLSFSSKSNFFLLFLTLSACSSAEQVKYEQYMIAGEQLYAKHCSNCHGSQGLGLANLYPPLSKSDFLQNFNQTLCVIKNGAKGKMTVNGVEYDQIMPQNKQLYDLDIAQIATYMYTKWGNKNDLIVAEVVKEAKCTIAQ